MQFEWLVLLVIFAVFFCLGFAENVNEEDMAVVITILVCAFGLVVLIAMGISFLRKNRKEI